MQSHVKAGDQAASETLIKNPVVMAVPPLTLNQGPAIITSSLHSCFRFCGLDGNTMQAYSDYPKPLGSGLRRSFQRERAQPAGPQPALSGGQKWSSGVRLCRLQ